MTLFLFFFCTYGNNVGSIIGYKVGFLEGANEGLLLLSVGTKLGDFDSEGLLEGDK